MMKIVNSNKCDYDLQNDTILFYGVGNNYKSSLDFDGLIVDFDDEDYLMGVEILDASKRFNISKHSLLYIKKFDLTLEITKEQIRVTMDLKIFHRNKSVAHTVSTITTNSTNITPCTQGISVSC